MSQSGPRSPVTLTVAEIARLVKGEVRGDGSVTIRGVAPIHQAEAAEIGMLFDRDYLEHLDDCQAGAVLVSEELSAFVAADRSCVIVSDARQALAPILERFHPPEPAERGIHPTAVIGRNVTLGEGVAIGPYTVLEDNVTVGDRTRLHAHVVVGRGASIGSDAVLHPHVALYAGAVLADRVVLHSGVCVGVDGFGYSIGSDGPKKIPHVGACVVGEDVEIGANSCVDRGSIGATRIGRGTKLDNLVHLGHNVEVGPNSLMAAQVGIAGSTRVGAGTMWGGQSGIIDHKNVADGARVSPQAGVTDDLGEGETVAGFPARPVKDFNRAIAGLYKLRDLRKRVRELEVAVRTLESSAE